MTPKILILSNLPEAALDGVVAGIQRTVAQLGGTLPGGPSPQTGPQTPPGWPHDVYRQFDQLRRAHEQRDKIISDLTAQFNAVAGDRDRLIDRHNTLVDSFNSLCGENDRAQAELKNVKEVNGELRATLESMRLPIDSPKQTAVRPKPKKTAR